MLIAMALLRLEIRKVRSNVERLRHAKKFERAAFRIEQAKNLQKILDLLEAEYYDLREQT